ncbi:triphosphoribosyl-dephospho-CoA synthase [Sphaerotilus hippei]|nr:triphosphoribosyl-dephospho-CoA synthase [Sphaerotilus hippei]
MTPVERPARRARQARQAFLRACHWDVAVRKPGNVSHLSTGHGMQARQFIDSALACADLLCRPGAAVGERIEAAVTATRARVGCNTNLGILLLCAPLARAAEALEGLPADASTLRAAVQWVMAGLTLEDAAAAFRAIARASPGGLGEVQAQDVRQRPGVTLREAMALASGRDRIALQYVTGGAELFDVGLKALAAADPGGGRLGGQGLPATAARPAEAAVVQAVYLAYLASAPDSHIVRKHGPALAQTVMDQAGPWRDRLRDGGALDADPAWVAWDETLKARGLNPGTSADLTVATLMLADLLAWPDAADALA